MELDGLALGAFGIMWLSGLAPFRHAGNDYRSHSTCHHYERKICARKVSFKLQLARAWNVVNVAIFQRHSNYSPKLASTSTKIRTSRNIGSV